jgi:hypothetical protein
MAIGIGSLIGAGLKVGSAIFGGIKQRKAAKRQEARVNQMKRENEDWFNRRYNEDATQRADAQRLITLTQDAMRRSNQAAAGTAAVMGGTTESIAAAKAASNQAMADTTSQIAASAEARKDAIEQQYMANKANLNEQLNQIDTKKAQNTAQAVQSGIGAVGDMLGDLNDTLGYIGK